MEHGFVRTFHSCEIRVLSIYPGGIQTLEGVFFGPELYDVPRVRPSAQDRLTPSNRNRDLRAKIRDRRYDRQIDRLPWTKEIMANDECREKQTMRPIIDGGDNERSPTMRPNRGNPVHRLEIRARNIETLIQRGLRELRG
jgi:hypothetical protein